MSSVRKLDDESNVSLTERRHELEEGYTSTPSCHNMPLIELTKVDLLLCRWDLMIFNDPIRLRQRVERMTN